jgi:hypothetical protein
VKVLAPEEIQEAVEAEINTSSEVEKETAEIEEGSGGEEEKKE